MYSVSQSSTNDEEECLDEIIDRKFVTQERKKEVVDDFTEKDREIVDKSTILEEADDDEPLTGDLKVPFFCLNNYEGNVTSAYRSLSPSQKNDDKKSKSIYFQ